MYTITLLATGVACDTMAGRVTKEKGILEFQKRRLEMQLEFAGETSLEVDGLIADLTSRISSADLLIASLAEGQQKTDAIAEKGLLTYKLNKLNKRDARYGEFSQLELEFELNRIQHEITEADTFLSAIQARKLEVPAA